MKTIQEYSNELLNLANEMERDLGCIISDICLERYEGDESKPFNQCRIEFRYKQTPTMELKKIVK